jgi:glyoxylase-like metal-dependent hydrolase (beta-lactamase superfamily II)
VRAIARFLRVALLLASLPAAAEPVPGSLPLHWNEGAADCAANPQPPLEVHAYEPRTFILRQSPCATFEAPFLYLLVGSERALLIDTGAIEDPAAMPLAETVARLLGNEGAAQLPLLVVHTHAHSDHRAGDAQFRGRAGVEVVPAQLEAVRAHFRLDEWPRGAGRIDLGDRVVDLIPVPGHHAAHLAFYDQRTALLLTGDFLLRGRLLIDDLDAYRASAQRLIEFVEPLPVAHVLGAHVELDDTGELFAWGSEHHPGEAPLALTRDDLVSLPAALGEFNGFFASHPHYVLSNPLRNLAASAAGVLGALGLAIWATRSLLRRRRRIVHNAG